MTNQKGFVKILIILAVIAIAAGIFGYIFKDRIFSRGGIRLFNSGVDIEKDSMEIPDDYFATFKYFQVTGDPVYPSDLGTIEATVQSVNIGQKCPYTSDSEKITCPIDPYPYDSGTVVVDSILSYSPFAERPVTDEGAGNNPIPNDGDFVTGNKGVEYPSRTPEYNPLKEGDHVFTRFLLTSRPSKVKYAVVESSSKSRVPNLEFGQKSAETKESESTSSGAISGEQIYPAIPRDGDYFVFTTRINQPQASEKILPGLKVGDKFRAEIRYNGTLYVEEYELIQQ